MQSTSERIEQSPPRAHVDRPRLLPIHADRRHLLPISEVAPRTGLSRWTIYRRINSGEWPSVRSGRAHLIPRAFIDRLIAESEDGSQVIASEGAA